MAKNEDAKATNAYYGEEYAYGGSHHFLFKEVSMQAEEIYEITEALRRSDLDPRVRRTLMGILEHQKRELARLIRLLEMVDSTLGSHMRIRPGEYEEYYDMYEQEKPLLET